MRIEKGAPGFGQPDKSSRMAKPADITAFKTHLEKALVKNDSEHKPLLSVAALPSPGVVTPMLGSGVDPHTVVQGYEDFLGALSIYQERLGDARYDLKLLEQDLNRIGAHCRQLDEWLQHTSVDDDLRVVLREGLTTARIEIERFYAGEYC